jgi:hypothetical protein
MVEALDLLSEEQRASQSIRVISKTSRATSLQLGRRQPRLFEFLIRSEPDLAGRLGETPQRASYRTFGHTVVTQAQQRNNLFPVPLEVLRFNEILARSERFELPTLRFEVWCSDLI